MKFYSLFIIKNVTLLLLYCPADPYYPGEGAEALSQLGGSRSQQQREKQGQDFHCQVYEQIWHRFQEVVRFAVKHEQ